MILSNLSQSSERCVVIEVVVWSRYFVFVCDRVCSLFFEFDRARRTDKRPKISCVNFLFFEIDRARCPDNGYKKNASFH